MRGVQGYRVDLEHALEKGKEGDVFSPGSARDDGPAGRVGRRRPPGPLSDRGTAVVPAREGENRSDLAMEREMDGWIDGWIDRWGGRGR